jgi:hypothetical protein
MKERKFFGEWVIHDFSIAKEMEDAIIYLSKDPYS